MTGTAALNAKVVHDAAQALVDWQKSVSDQAYADINERSKSDQIERFNAQAQIVSSLLESSDSYLSELRMQVGAELTDEALDSVPLIKRHI